MFEYWYYNEQDSIPTPPQHRPQGPQTELDETLLISTPALPCKLDRQETDLAPSPKHR